MTPPPDHPAPYRFPPVQVAERPKGRWEETLDAIEDGIQDAAVVVDALAEPGNYTLPALAAGNLVDKALIVGADAVTGNFNLDTYGQAVGGEVVKAIQGIATTRNRPPQIPPNTQDLAAQDRLGDTIRNSVNGIQMEPVEPGEYPRIYPTASSHAGSNPSVSGWSEASSEPIVRDYRRHPVPLAPGAPSSHGSYHSAPEYPGDVSVSEWSDSGTSASSVSLRTPTPSVVSSRPSVVSRGSSSSGGPSTMPPPGRYPTARPHGPDHHYPIAGPLLHETRQVLADIDRALDGTLRADISLPGVSDGAALAAIEGGRRGTTLGTQTHVPGHNVDVQTVGRGGRTMRTQTRFPTAHADAQTEGAATVESGVDPHTENAHVRTQTRVPTTAETDAQTVGPINALAETQTPIPDLSPEQLDLIFSNQGALRNLLFEFRSEVERQNERIHAADGRTDVARGQTALAIAERQRLEGVLRELMVNMGITDLPPDFTIEHLRDLVLDENTTGRLYQQAREYRDLYVSGAHRQGAELSDVTTQYDIGDIPHHRGTDPIGSAALPPRQRLHEARTLRPNAVVRRQRTRERLHALQNARPRNARPPSAPARSPTPDIYGVDDMDIDPPAPPPVRRPSPVPRSPSPIVEPPPPIVQPPRRTTRATAGFREHTVVDHSNGMYRGTRGGFAPGRGGHPRPRGR